MPSSTAARVACRASSTRAFFSFISTLGGRADLDDRHAADELGEALLELLAVVVGGGGLDLLADLPTRPSTASRLPAPSTIVVLSLSTTTLLGAAEVSEGDVLELDAEVLA
jgi:hypothetical protein